MTRSPARIVLVSIALLLMARAAAAQSPVYVTATGFADIERFGSSNAVGYTLSGENPSLDATAAGGGVRVGTFLHPKWTLELAIDDEAATKVTLRNQYSILAIYTPIPIPTTTSCP